MNDWNKLRNSLKESIAPPTNSQYGSSVISEYRIPHASHSILSFFPPNYDSSSGGSASNETPPRLSHSIMSLLPPNWSQSESSRSDESLPPFSHSIPSLFPPNWSQSESSRSDESLPPFSHSIPSIFPPTQSETESSESNERLITRSSHSLMRNIRYWEKGGCSRIEGIWPPLKPPPGMRLQVIDNACSTWELLKLLAPDAERGSSVMVQSGLLSSSSDDEVKEEQGKRSITNWEKGKLLGRGSFGSVYEGISE